jgi:hypothetical protein
MKSVSVIAFFMMLSVLGDLGLHAQSIPRDSTTIRKKAVAVSTPRGTTSILDLLSPEYTSQKFIVQDSTSVPYKVTFKLEEHKADKLRLVTILFARGQGRMPFELMTDPKDEMLHLIIYTQSESCRKAFFPEKGHRIKWRTLESLDVNQLEVVPVLLMYHEKIGENFIEKKIDKLFSDSKINSASMSEIEKKVRLITADFSLITYQKQPQ